MDLNFCWLGILLASLWVYEFSTKVKKLTRQKGLSVAIACLVILTALLVTAYKIGDKNGQHTDSPQAMPRSPVSKTSPLEIKKSMDDVPPYQRLGVANGFIGVPVEWRLSLFAIEPTRNSQMNVCFSFHNGTESALIFAIIPEKGNEFLHAAKIGDLFTVSGVIDPPSTIFNCRKFQ